MRKQFFHSIPIRGFQHGKKNIFIGVMAFCVLFTGIMLICCHNYRRHRYQNSYETAQACVERCEYENAVTEYQTAIKYCKKNKKDLILRLSNLYIKMDQYEKAVQVLQSYYTESKDITVKYRVEEVIDTMVEKEYTSRIQRGNHYSGEEEYKKAIQEYRVAYRLEPNNREVLQLMINAYLNDNQINKAEELYGEVEEHLTKSMSIIIEKRIEKAKLKQQYNQLIKEADELYGTDRNNDCFAMYQQAIELMPYESEAYEKIIGVYVDQMQYEEALALIHKYLNEYHYETLTLMIEDITEKQKTEDTYNHIFNQVYDAMKNSEIDALMKLLHSASYRKQIAEGTVYYFNAANHRMSTQIPSKEGLIIYSSGYLYSGSFLNGKRHGEGSIFSMSDNALGYMLYTGDWKDDLPNGKGKLKTVMNLMYDNEGKQFQVTVQGEYCDGMENGPMRRDFYLDGEYYGTLEYQCSHGIPQPEDSKSIKSTTTNIDSYTIGSFMGNEKTFEVTYFTTYAKWGVPGV